jgi:hypothetical protein
MSVLTGSYVTNHGLKNIEHQTGKKYKKEAFFN